MLTSRAYLARIATCLADYDLDLLQDGHRLTRAGGTAQA